MQNQLNSTPTSLKHRALLTVFVGLTALVFFLHPQVGIFVVMMQTTQRWIIPSYCATLSLNWSTLQHKFAASTWAVMQQMGAVDVIAISNGDGVHHLESVMTMRSDLHQGFDRLGLWFEATVRYHFTALVQICLTWRQYIRTFPINTRYALVIPICSIAFHKGSLLLHRTMHRYLTHAVWLYTLHVPRSHIFLVQGSISKVLTVT